MIKSLKIFFIVSIFIFLRLSDASSQGQQPIDSKWLKIHLKKSPPRLILTSKIESKLKSKIKEDSLASQYFSFLRANADTILTKQVLTRKVEGRRLLAVSREAVYRLSTLSLVYRVTKAPKYLRKLEEEMNAVCEFIDWNPSHFLDVAEMALAVSIGIDWSGQFLSEKTLRKAKDALLIKAISPSFEVKYNFWIGNTNNWNQVCHGGMVAAALAIAEDDLDLAAKTIERAVNKIPLALNKGYSPDGAYPEGPTYWEFGTTYSVLTFSMFQTALDTDFQLSNTPGFLESAKYILLMNAPSGECFNYADSDCPKGLDLHTSNTLTWFAQKTRDGNYLDEDNLRSLINTSSDERLMLSRFSATALIWLSQFEKKTIDALPVYWKGEGENPVIVFRSKPGENASFYLAAKGGSASVSHGNMDAGSFVFEAGGVRWAIDPGNQDYHTLEKILGAEVLWNGNQDSKRWSLLTKDNKFHNTITVDGERHNVRGFAPIEKFSVEGKYPSATFNLTEVFNGQLEKASRTFTKVNEKTLRIEDDVVLSQSTKKISWMLMTTADINRNPDALILKKNGKKLEMKVLSPANCKLSITSLNPPPLPYDKVIEGLKRIEVIVPAGNFEKGSGKIVVEIRLAEST